MELSDDSQEGPDCFSNFRSCGPSQSLDDHAEQQCQTQEHIEPVEPTQPQSRKAHNQAAVAQAIAWEKHHIVVFELDSFGDMDRYLNLFLV